MRNFLYEMGKFCKKWENSIRNENFIRKKGFSIRKKENSIGNIYFIRALILSLASNCWLIKLWCQIKLKFWNWFYLSVDRLNWSSLSILSISMILPTSAFSSILWIFLALMMLSTSMVSSIFSNSYKLPISIDNRSIYLK